MSDEPRIVELVPPGEPLIKSDNPDIPDPPPVSTPKASKIIFGYAVGVREDGELFFEVIGQAGGLIELLGLHTYAKECLDNIISTKMENNNSIIINKLDSLITLVTSRR